MRERISQVSAPQFFFRVRVAKAVMLRIMGRFRGVGYWYTRRMALLLMVVPLVLKQTANRVFGGYFHRDAVGRW
ncbi:hypothetical protein JCM17961_19900 [Endothiovibrio diazotrophicus]